MNPFTQYQRKDFYETLGTNTNMQSRVEEKVVSLLQFHVNATNEYIVRASDVSFICELLQWTTSLWRMNEVLHILKIKYFIH